MHLCQTIFNIDSLYSVYCNNIIVFRQICLFVIEQTDVCLMEQAIFQTNYSYTIYRKTAVRL